MKGASLLQGLGMLPPTLLQQRAPSSSASSSYTTTSLPTFSSHFHSCRHLHRHSRSHPSRQQQRATFLDTESLSSVPCSRKSHTSFYGDTKELDQQSPLQTKKKGKDPGKGISISMRHQLGSRQSDRNFNQSYQERGKIPSLMIGPKWEPNFSPPSIDKSWGSLDQSGSSRAPVPADLNTSRWSSSRILEHKMAESRSDHLVSSPKSGQTTVRSSTNSIQTSAGRPLSNVEPSYMVADQARNSHNGAHAQSRLSNKQVIFKYEGSVIRQAPKVNNSSKRWGPKVSDLSRVPTMAALLQQGTEDRFLEISSRRKPEDFSNLEKARYGNQALQRDLWITQTRDAPAERMEAARKIDQNVLTSQTQGAAAKWREAAKKIEQNRRPAHTSGGIEGGGIEGGGRNSDCLNVEFEPVGDFENGYGGSEDHKVSVVHEPEGLSGEKGQFAASSEKGSADQSGQYFASEERRLQLGCADVLSEEAESPIHPNGEQRWMNTEVLVVNCVSSAEAVVDKLRGQYKDFIHACDTEVAEIDVKKESPVGHGHMICFSIYCGPMTDFGCGKCRLWVDVLDKPAVLNVFKSYFEDPSIKKVWHNYSFDKHILANHDINAQGFHADTMHLARLYDSARTVVQGGYSLEGLTSDKNVMGDHWGKLEVEETSSGKRSMKQLFGKPNIKKNGEEGKLRVVPPVEELQTQPEWRDKWIHYSSFDTVCTWHLWKSLQDKLKKKEWFIEGKVRQEGKSMYDFYLDYLQPFGKLLVQMEADGMMLDREHLAKIEDIAIKQQEFSANEFKKWAAQRCPDAMHMNVGSDAQIRQLLFGGKSSKNHPNKRLELERIFNAPNTENYLEAGRKTPKKTRPFTLCGLGADIPVDSYTSAGWPAVGGAALKVLAGKVSIDYTMLDEAEPVEDDLVSGTSGEDSAVLTSTGVKGGSGEDLSVYGKAYNAFGGGKEGKEACRALAALCEVASINTLISNFIQPLQGSDIMGPDGRVHCSLNINTETGRLSARRPSLQNQPALEKDRYKIRQAFIAAPGHSLIVADYGQLELRILAHLTDCKSMLKAFLDGGDFHSRTAMNMYPHVRKAVDNGDVILEWEPKPGEQKSPVPLLKDIFGAERRKAKMLNFSIAYGKTAMGLSKDWKVSLDEAKSTVELWYSDRQEVRQWQQQRIKEANDTHHVHTLLGRTRHFPDVTSRSMLVRGHIERAAINTPVQGSAADVAMCAMLAINDNKTLRDLGWKLLLQVHDEVILEGPSESAAEAKDIVVNCMGFPFGGKNILRVALAVDAKYAQSWYAAK